jgi:hypothetical protein
MEGNDGDGLPDDAASSADSTRNESSDHTAAGQNAPRVVKFAYKSFKVSGDRWHASCRTCNKRIQDTVNVTSAFTK